MAHLAAGYVFMIAIRTLPRERAAVSCKFGVVRGGVYEGEPRSGLRRRWNVHECRVSDL